MPESLYRTNTKEKEAEEKKQEKEVLEGEGEGAEAFREGEILNLEWSVSCPEMLLK